MHSSIFSLVLTTALCLLLTPALSSARDVQEILASGKLVMLTFPNQESAFTSIDTTQGPMPEVGRSGHFLGIDVELVQAFADSMGVDLEIRPVSEPRFAALIPDLLSNRGDLIASSFSITPERREIVDFSDPYFSIHAVLVARNDSGIQGPESLHELIGTAVDGSSHAARMVRMGLDKSMIIEVDFLLETYGLVTDGDADFTIADSSNPVTRTESYPDLEVVYEFPDNEDYGFALPKGSDLTPFINQFLKESRANGLLEQILAKYGLGA